jgi:hypothetical protein
LFITRISNPTQNWTLKTTTAAEEQEQKHKKDEKDARLLSPPGCLTRGRGEKRRDEIVQQLAELLRSTGT